MCANQKSEKADETNSLHMLIVETATRFISSFHAKWEILEKTTGTRLGLVHS